MVGALRRLGGVAMLAFLSLALLGAAPPPRIVAVGDLHGDYRAWQDIARDAGLIDGAGKWAGGATILVQLGDMTDRGDDSLKIITSLRALQREAPRAGGRVVVMLGNHEAMNVVGDLRYVTPGEFAAFATPQSAAARERYFTANKVKIEEAAKDQDPNQSPAAIRARWFAQTPLGWVEHRQAWSPGGELNRWARTSPAVIRINGNLFAHGGISVEQTRVSIDETNRRAAAAIARADDNPTSILNDPLGPLWYRGLVMKDADAAAARQAAGSPQPDRAAELKTVLAAYQAKRLIVGHTPNLKGIVLANDNTLVRVDTGNARYYNGQLSWLEISGDTLTAHVVKRSSP